MLAGVGIAALGALMLVQGLKGPWYRVPLSIGEDGDLIYSKSMWEMPLKAVLCGVVFLSLGIWLRRWRDVLLRAKVFYSIGLAAFVVGLTFSHLTIVNEGELSHRAAWILSQHDNLTWLGGDIYTAREYEQVGGGLDLMAKDPQQILGSVPLPYFSVDLGSLHDFFDWMGLGSPFTTFKGKGWGFLMVGAIFTMVGALATRLPGARDRLASQVVSFGVRSTGIAMICCFVAVGARVAVAAKALENAREFGDDADYPAAVASMEWAKRVMPCLHFDTSMIAQQGLYEHQNRRETPAANYYRALVLETGNFKTQAESIYIDLTESADEPVRREALRALFRLGIIDFNSGQEMAALRRTESLLTEFPALPKALYVRLLLAVRLGQKDEAFASLKRLYTVAGGIDLSEKRSYLSSGHQHLIDLAYSAGDYHEAWKQSVNRVELEK
ncbi:MAG: hypothetical protein R3F19_22925 [Verrucomicrobiales bacterium]